MNENTYWKCTLKTGEILDFGGKCNEVNHKDPNVCVFKETWESQRERYWKILAIIPYASILKIESIERRQRNA